MRRLVLISITVVAVVLAVAIYFSFDPSVSRFFPRCIFLTLTGYQCPGCGTQRALHALLHGNLAAAWHYNAALIVALPLIALYAYAECYRKTKVSLYRSLNSPVVITLLLVAIVSWWVMRNVLGL